MTQDEALQMLAEVFQEPPGTLLPERSRADLPGWDSMGAMILMAELDDRLGILPSAADIQAMQSIADVLQHLRRLDALAD